jgi:hypothetical protein
VTGAAISSQCTCLQGYTGKILLIDGASVVREVSAPTSRLGWLALQFVPFGYIQEHDWVRCLQYLSFKQQFAAGLDIFSCMRLRKLKRCSRVVFHSLCLDARLPDSLGRTAVLAPVKQTCAALGFNPDCCAACLIGSFKPSPGSSACTLCPTNSTTLGAGSFDCLCQAGYQGSDKDHCIRCPSDSYKSSVSNSDCVSCASNSHSPAGSIDVTNCQCAQGFSVRLEFNGAFAMHCLTDSFQGPSGSACSSCPAGRYKTLVGASPCVQCQAGYARSSCAVAWPYFGTCAVASGPCLAPPTARARESVRQTSTAEAAAPRAQAVPPTRSLRRAPLS